MTFELDEASKTIEAILFLENSPLTVERLSSLTQLEIDDVRRSLSTLKEHYQARNSGLMLYEEEGLYSFQPVKEIYPVLRKTYARKVDRRLSRAVLETLSIIAYRQPVTRSEIDSIRGVRSSDQIVRMLRERDYVKIAGRNSVHANLYSTTRKFLIEFGLKSITDLPRLTGEDRLKFDRADEGELF